MSGHQLGDDRHAALKRWPQLENLWRYCRHLDAWVNRGLTDEEGE